MRDDSTASADLLAGEASAWRTTRRAAPVDRREVLRYLGYPARAVPPPWLESSLERWIDQASRLARPQATWVVLPVVNIGPRRLVLASIHGDVQFEGAIGEFLAASRRVAAFVATAGSEVERLAESLMQRSEMLAALIVNAVGSERAEAAEASVIESLRDEAPQTGLVPTLPYSPGYCGMALTEQRKLFSVFAGQDLGVTLSSDCLMRPLKSVSGLIGLGLPEDVRRFGSPCDRCDVQRCAMRRTA